MTKTPGSRAIDAEIARREFEDQKLLILAKQRKLSGQPVTNPHLAYHVQAGDELLPKPKLVTCHRSGQGGTELDFHTLKSAELKATKALIKEGRLVPTFTQQANPYDHIQLLTHFDDVRWGRRESGETIIYSLSLNPEWPDDILTLDSSHDAALEELNNRIRYRKVLLDHTILLKPETAQGMTRPEAITPMITDHHVIHLRERQASYLAPQARKPEYATLDA